MEEVYAKCSIAKLEHTYFDKVRSKDNWSIKEEKRMTKKMVSKMLKGIIKGKLLKITNKTKRLTVKRWLYSLIKNTMPFFKKKKKNL